MYERFTDRARKAMQLANQEAKRLHHEYIGTEHILLGLIKEGTGGAAIVLNNLDLDLKKIRQEVEKIVQSGPDIVTIGKLPQTPRARKAIQYSIDEARNLKHNYMDTEHLLLGLLREQEGVAAQVLMNLGLTLEKVREEVLALLGHHMEPADCKPEPTAPEAPRPVYELFTDRARKVMQLANQEAQRLNHEYIGTEHILLGLIKEGSGVAANVLKNLDVDLKKIRLEVEKILHLGPHMPTIAKLPMTLMAKNVLEYSIEEARNLNHNYVGTEHLLLGLLREPESVAADVLMHFGLTLDKVRDEVLALLGHNTDHDAGGGSAGTLRDEVLALLGDNTDRAESSGEATAADAPHHARLPGWYKTCNGRYDGMVLFVLGFLATIWGAVVFVNTYGSETQYLGAILGGVIVLAVCAWCYLITDTQPKDLG